MLPDDLEVLISPSMPPLAATQLRKESEYWHLERLKVECRKELFHAALHRASNSLEGDGTLVQAAKAVRADITEGPWKPRFSDDFERLKDMTDEELSCFYDERRVAEEKTLREIDDAKRNTSILDLYSPPHSSNPTTPYTIGHPYSSTPRTSYVSPYAPVPAPNNGLAIPSRVIPKKALVPRTRLRGHKSGRFGTDDLVICRSDHITERRVYTEGNDDDLARMARTGGLPRPGEITLPFAQGERASVRRSASPPPTPREHVEVKSCFVALASTLPMTMDFDAHWFAERSPSPPPKHGSGRPIPTTKTKIDSERSVTPSPSPPPAKRGRGRPKAARKPPRTTKIVVDLDLSSAFSPPTTRSKRKAGSAALAPVPAPVRAPPRKPARRDRRDTRKVLYAPPTTTGGKTIYASPLPPAARSAVEYTSPQETGFSGYDGNGSERGYQTRLSTETDRRGSTVFRGNNNGDGYHHGNQTQLGHEEEHVDDPAAPGTVYDDETDDMHLGIELPSAKRSRIDETDGAQLAHAGVSPTYAQSITNVRREAEAAVQTAVQAAPQPTFENTGMLNYEAYPALPVTPERIRTQGGGRNADWENYQGIGVPLSPLFYSPSGRRTPTFPGYLNPICPDPQQRPRPSPRSSPMPHCLAPIVDEDGMLRAPEEAEMSEEKAQLEYLIMHAQLERGCIPNPSV
jgi:hypothetical protein